MVGNGTGVKNWCQITFVNINAKKSFLNMLEAIYQ